MDSELPTLPMDFEVLTLPTEFSEKNEKDHEPEVNLESEPSLSDSSEISSSDSEQRKRKAKRRKSVVSIGKMTRQIQCRVMTLIHPRTFIIGVNNAKSSHLLNHLI